MRSFDDETALEPQGGGVFEGNVADGWTTARGPLGGYVMAIVVRGFELTVGDDARTARSLTMHFLRVPEAGPVTVRVTLEREGRSLSTLSARLEQNGKLLGLALAAYSKPWESPLLDDAPMPDVAPAEGRDPIGPLPGRRQPPQFAQQLTMQHRFGEAPFTGAEHGEAGGWMGLVGERPLDALSLVVIADAWFPAPWPRLKALAPAPTIDLTVHLRSPLPLPDSLVLGRFTSKLVRDGFFEEDGELWTPDGTLIAQSRQLGLLIGAEAAQSG